MTDFFEVKVPGRPRPKGSWKAIQIKGRARLVPDNKRSKPWQDAVALHARAAWTGDPWPRDIPVILSITFILKRPAIHFFTKGGKPDRGRLRPDAPDFPIGQRNYPDLDKLIRTIMDALTGIVYEDDVQVVSFGHVCKVFSPDFDGALIRAESMKPGN